MVAYGGYSRKELEGKTLKELKALPIQKSDKCYKCIKSGWGCIDCVLED